VRGGGGATTDTGRIVTQEWEARFYKGTVAFVSHDTTGGGDSVLRPVRHLARLVLCPRYEEERTMLSWALTFLVLALIAGLLGFSGIAGVSANIAWIFFVVFLVLTVVAAVARAVRGNTPV
jgi:uncharacterized membrane protein YtjA (UPF0391 family)